MKLRLSLSLVLLVAILAACAPSAGSQITRINPRGSEVVLDPVTGGRVELSYQLSDFGVERDDLRAFVTLPMGVHGTTTEVGSSFAVVDARIPGDWEVRLHEAWLDEVVTPGPFGTENVRETLRIVLSVHPAPNSVSGPYRIRTNINARDGRSNLVTFTATIP